MKKDGMGWLVATITIIALIIIGLIFFREKLLVISATACIVVLPFLPFYYEYRKNEGKKRLAVEHETEEAVRESIENLDDLEEMVAECIIRFDEIRDLEKWKEEMRRISRDEENWDEEQTAIEELESRKEEIKSITENLKDIHSRLNPLAYY